MEKRNLADGLLYSDAGHLFHFVIDIDKAEEYGLGDTLKDFTSATYDFLKCYVHGKEIHKAKLLKFDEKINDHRKQLLTENTKALNKIKKGKLSLKKAIKALKDDKTKKFDIKKKFDERNVEIKKRLMKSNLTPYQIKLVLKEIEKLRKTVDDEGEIALLELLANSFSELEKNLSEPESAWNDFGATCAAIILIIIIITLIGIAIATGIEIVNLATREIHDSDRIVLACKIQDMSSKNKLFIDDFEAVLNLFRNEGFNGCAWCMPEYNTG